MSKKYDYDVIYIGAGVGSVNGAVPLANRGYRVAIVESQAIGGTCPNWGCTAKYTLDAPAQLAYRANHFSHIYGDNQLHVDWKRDMARKHRNIDSGPATGMKHRIKAAGIKTYMTHGTLMDNHTVKVDDQKITADKLVLVPGLTPHHLNVPGTELTHDSRDFLSLDNLPKRMVVIGTGYVGIELATIANAGGADVTVMMHHDRPLRGFYEPFADQLVKSLEKRGMHFVKSAKVAGFKKSGDHLIVEYGDHQQLATDYVLDASGRIPNLKHLGLENTDVKYNRHGIEVNGYLQTSVPNIYATGDVIDSKIEKLSPTATYETRYLTRLLSGETDQPMSMPAVPTAVYSSPRIAKVGVAVDQAKAGNQKHPGNFKIVIKDLSNHMWYKATGQTHVAARALIFNRFDRLVGAEEISGRADDAISILAILISLHATNEQIERMVRLFPSQASDLLSDF
ncbi:MAG: NAD(P)/FAD-dependent oxidoreductase [Acetilactobacillus jinshanensis]